MKHTKAILFAAALSVLLLSCSQRYYYNVGLYRAQNPKPDNVYDQLTELTPANKDLTWKTINGQQYVLAATWTTDTPAYTTIGHYDSAAHVYGYNTKGHKIWITLDPYLKNEPYNHLSDDKLNMRLRQLIGLPPIAPYKYFLEVWVRPEDVVRPCFNPAVDTNVCEFIASERDKRNVSYSYWLYQYLYNSYSDTNHMNRYPFSHLGYTYDWNHKNKSHVGLSEFVIESDRNIYVNKVYTTRQYFPRN